jgi:hypothetical protein
VTAFYGVDASGWDYDRLTGFAENIPRLKAGRTLDELFWHPEITLSLESLADLILRQTGDKQQAELAALRYGKALLRQGRQVT